MKFLYLVTIFTLFSVWKICNAQTIELVKQINTTSASSSPGNFVDINGTAYFLAFDNTNNRNLWKSDGTTAGTIMVKKIVRSGVNREDPIYYKNINVNGTLYFLGNDGINGDELWKSNGTSAGSVMVKNIAPGSASVRLEGMTNVNGILYFFLLKDTGLDLWKSNGTDAGTVFIKSFPTMAIPKPVAFKGKLYFQALDQAQNYEIWSSDGTAAGTVILKNIASNANSGLLTTENLTVNNGKLFFLYDTDDSHRKLWTSDGSPAGTVAYYDIFPGTKAFFSGIKSANNLVYFATQRSPYSNEELWRTDGTAQGTLRLLNNTSDGGNNFSMKVWALRDKVIFSAYLPGIGRQLWRTDGTAAGTSVLKDPKTGLVRLSEPYEVAVANNLMYFVADGQLFVTDGTAAGTHLATRRFEWNIWPIDKLTAVGDKVLFAYTFITRSGRIEGPELFRFDPDTKVQPDTILEFRLSDDNTARNGTYANSVSNVSGNLGVKSGSFPSFQRNAYLKFQMIGINAVKSARLRIYGRNLQNSRKVSVAAYRTAPHWSEYFLTWNNAPQPAGASSAPVMVNNVANFYEIDVTGIVNAQLPGNDLSIMLTNPGNDNSELSFANREDFHIQEQIPRLIVETLPSQVTARTSTQENIPMPEQPASTVFPNPAGRHFKVELSQLHQGQVDFQLLNTEGKAFEPEKQVAGKQVNLTLPDAAVPGIYVLKIHSATKQELIRVLLAR